jgi:hypothetical protein
MEWAEILNEAFAKTVVAVGEALSTKVLLGTIDLGNSPAPRYATE